MSTASPAGERNTPYSAESDGLAWPLGSPRVGGAEEILASINRANHRLRPGAKGFKAELDGLRERMRALGFSYDEIAAEESRRYQVRPRQAYRLAWGWTLDQVAARLNERAASEGTDPEGRAGMTGPHLCEVEKWPDSSRKPSVYVLCLLAGVYETDVLCLLDLADHESLPQQDRLVLMRRLRAETTFGERVLALMEARGLSLRELAGRPADLDGAHERWPEWNFSEEGEELAARSEDGLCMLRAYSPEAVGAGVRRKRNCGQGCALSPGTCAGRRPIPAAW
jgi:transcriptional regulator with XRE-family HTH domain